MSFFDEFKLIKSGRNELRKFGLTVGIGLIILSGLIYLAHHRFNALLLWQIPAAAILAALLVPQLLLPFQKIWMGISIILGFVMTRIILGILFYLILTPIGQISKLAGNDLLNRKQDPAAESYWNRRKKSAEQNESFDHQF